MTIAKLDIGGGIVADRSEYSVGPKWNSGDKVRFQQSLPEKIGGWSAETNWTFTGQPSNIHVWTTLNGSQCLVIGTEQKVELIANNVKYNITPVRKTTDTMATDPFAVVNTDSTITATDNAHGAEVGDFVSFSGASAGGGITISGEYKVTSTADANTYTFEHGSAASSTDATTGGGSVVATYGLSIGSPAATVGLGWGAGTWSTPRKGAILVQDTITGITQANPGVVTCSAPHGLLNGDQVELTAIAGMVQLNGTIQTVANKASTTFQVEDTSGMTSYSSAGKVTLVQGWGEAANAADSSVSLEPSLWSFSNWGEDLIATRRGEATYQWDASAGPTSVMTVISNSPSTSLFSMVSVPDRHLVCFGAHDGSSSDPLNIRWSDQEDNTTWAPGAANTAGSQRLAHGTKIVAGIQTRDQILIFTDDSIFGMDFQGPPYTFGFRPLGHGAAPLSQNAVVEQNGIVFWPADGQFYTFDGAVKILPSPVRDHVFDNISKTGYNNVFGSTNKRFTEILWLYATGVNTVPDNYVGLNWATNEWFTGTLTNRTVWKDSISWQTNPMTLNSSGTLYYHEDGTGADDGGSVSVNVESGAFELPASNRGGPSDQLMLVDKFIPDMTIASGSVQLTLYFRKYPNATEVTKGPYTITSSTTKVSLRGKGRQMRIKYESSGTDIWKAGTPRIQYTEDGGR
jgi:hypothetical protein